jgi:hypothetical protein
VGRCEGDGGDAGTCGVPSGSTGMGRRAPGRCLIGGERIVSGRKRQRRSSSMESSRLSVSCVKDEGYELVWGNRAEMRRQRAREERSGAGGGLR